MDNKPKYNPKIHHRRSIRLKDYDYSKAGLYFITICVQGRKCLYGKIINDEMILNDAGKMTDGWWQKIPEKFPDILLDEYVIMPNHFHAIVENTGPNLYVHPNDIVGADPRVRPDDGQTDGQTQGSAPTGSTHLHSIIQWFKPMTTNEYIRNVKNNGWEPFDKKVWQRNYYEHIIRNEKEYLLIQNYIQNNPRRWNQDKFYEP
jgi:putative transposase